LRRSRTGRLAPIVLGLAVIGAAGWWVTNSPLFDMHRLEVTGNSHLSDDEVARLARLSRTTNVVWLKNRTVAGRIERDPWVLRARVSRTLPGTISVSIHERKAVAALEGRGRSVAVAADGTILGPVSAKARLPVIELPGAPTVLGSRIAGMPPQLLVARALPASLRRRVARIIQAGSSLTLILRDGVTVRYGDASEAGAKARALVSLLEWADDRGIRPDYIDVQAPAAPALLPRRSAATSG
jgi:cell division protein FtsQ